MTRAKMRKAARWAQSAGLGQPEHREALEDVLSQCRPGRTRTRLRARILRK